MLMVCILLATFAAGSIRAQVVRVGIYEAPPIVFTAMDGTFEGLVPEVLEAIARDEGWVLEYVHGTKTECVQRLHEGEIDLAVDFAESANNNDTIASSSFFIVWDVAYTREGFSIQSYHDMADRRIAIAGSENSDSEILQILDRLGIPYETVWVENDNDVLMLLSDRQVDVGIVDQLFGTLYFDDYNVEASPIIFNPRAICLTAHRGAQNAEALIDAINASIESRKDDPDSTYNRALSYYLGGGRGTWHPDRADNPPQLVLSPQEEAWIKAHPVIRIGIDPGFAPYEMLSADGTYEGIAADWLTLVSNRTGLKFELVGTGVWTDTVKAIQNKEIDLLPCIGKSKERSEFMIYSDPYLSFSRVIIARNEDEYYDMSDLAGKRIAVQEDSSHQEFLKESTPAGLLLYPDFNEALLAVSRGEADAAIGNLAVASHRLRSLMLTNIKMAAYAENDSNHLFIGIRNDWPELAGILDRAIQSISLQEQNYIYAKWMPLQKPVSPALDLTREERDWLLMHPRVTVAWDPNWAPVEFADKEGNPKGISMDYLAAFGDLLGIEFDTIPATPWQESYSKLLSHEIDMATCISLTEQRLEYFNFTEAYMTTPSVLFGRDDMAYIRNMDELEGLKTAVIANYATDDWITKNHPDIHPLRLASVDEAFTKLQRGEIDVYIEDVITGNYYLSKQRSHNIKIVGETPHSYNLRFAIRKDWPVFIGILRKAMDLLPEEDKTSFYRNWVWIKYEHGFNYPLFWKILIAGAVFLLAILFWNRKLSREIRCRKKVEHELDESRSKLSESYAHLKKTEEMKENLMHMILHDMRSPLQTIRASVDLLRNDSEALSIATRERELLDFSEDASNTVNAMIQDLLDIGRLETDQMALCRENSDLKKIAQQAIDSLRIQLQGCDCSASIKGTESWASMDSKVISRVFVNLIINAIKASPKNSSIEIRIVDTPTHAIAEVRDWGRGIPGEIQHQIFEKFVHGEGETSYAIPSIGLGLTFCKLAVESHQGTIEVQSNEGKGTTFRFSIPKV